MILRNSVGFDWDPVTKQMLFRQWKRKIEFELNVIDKKYGKEFKHKRLLIPNLDTDSFCKQSIY